MHAIRVIELEASRTTLRFPEKQSAITWPLQTDGQTQIFTSTNGREWGEPRMSHTAQFDDQSRVGLFNCSGNTFASTTAVFDFVHADH